MSIDEKAFAKAAMVVANHRSENGVHFSWDNFRLFIEQYEEAKSDQPVECAPIFDRNKVMNEMGKAHALFEYAKNECSSCKGTGREQDDTPCGNPNEAATCRDCSGRGYWQHNPTLADRWNAAMDVLDPYIRALRTPVRESVALLVPNGWRFYSADLSIEGRASVMLTRDAEGTRWWHRLHEVEQQQIDLFISGAGATLEEAIADASNKVGKALNTDIEGQS